MLYVFGLASAFACAWFVLAALQTFTDAAPQRMTNIVVALAFGVVSAALFWLARRAQREPARTREDAPGAGVTGPS